MLPDQRNSTPQASGRECNSDRAIIAREKRKKMQWKLVYHEVHPRTGHEGPDGEQKYSYTPSLTSALDGGGWSTPRTGCFTPGKDPVFYRRLGGPQGRSGRVRKIFPPPGIDRRTVQPVASRSVVKLLILPSLTLGYWIKCFFGES